MFGDRACLLTFCLLTDPSLSIAIDAIIVGVETQNTYLGNKKTWTRKVILVTDGEGPMELEDWEATVQKMNELNVGFTVVGVDFDDEEHIQVAKPHHKVSKVLR